MVNGVLFCLFLSVIILLDGDFDCRAVNSESAENLLF